LGKLRAERDASGKAQRGEKNGGASIREERKNIE